MQRTALVGLALVAGLAGFSVAFGLSGSLPGSIAGGLLAAAACGWCGRTWLALDEAAAPRALRIASATALVLALVQLGRLTVFMADASRTGFSQFPSSPWEIKHSCLTAYHVAGTAVGEGRNVFDPALYNAPDDDPGRQRRPATLGPFNVDVYEYPPPFLLLARALHFAAPDFFRLRALWHGLTLALLLAATLAAVRLLDRASGTRALLLAPLLWVAPPTLSALQKGNVQVAIIALCVLALFLFRRRLFAAGGLLLAVATLAKLFPGMLVLYLLARRQWRAAAWTAGMGIAVLLASLLDTGVEPYRAFLQHLPGLLGGEAFPAFRNPNAMAINLSIPGIVFKLKLLGVPGMGFPAAKLVGWIWTLAIAAATAVLARRAREDREILAWLAVLVLATLRSPFLPQAYGAMPPLWLLTLFAATLVPTTRTLLLTLGAAVVLAHYEPQDWGIPLGMRLATVGVTQVAMTALPLLLLRRAPETAQPA
ncbi:MAG: glycosyltransferase family 87 protein [Vicinamibacteria bacterium]